MAGVAMHPVSIYDHPLNMNARARISQPIKNVIYVNDRLFAFFTSQVICNISKGYNFQLKFLQDGNLTERDGVRFRWSGTVRSAVWAWRYGTECGSDFFAWYGSGPIFSVPCHSLVRIRPAQKNLNRTPSRPVKLANHTPYCTAPPRPYSVPSRPIPVP